MSSPSSPEKDTNTTMKAKTAYVVAYQASTGRTLWATEIRSTGAFANGLFCSPGLVFSAGEGATMFGLDATTGAKVVSFAVPECGDAPYNCAEVLVDRESLYLVTSKRFQKHSFHRTER